MTVFLLPSWDCDPHLLFLNSNESKGEKIWEERGHHWDQKKENIPWFYDFRIISWEWLRMMCCSENEESIGKDWKKEESKPLPKVSCRSCLKGPGWLNWAVYLSNAKKKKKKKKRRRKKERKKGKKMWRKRVKNLGCFQSPPNYSKVNPASMIWWNRNKLNCAIVDLVIHDPFSRFIRFSPFYLNEFQSH